MSTVTPALEIESCPAISAEEALRLIELVDVAFETRNLEELAECMLPAVARMMQSPSAILYVADSRLPAPCFLPYGAPPQVTSEIEHLCARQFE
jgi:hypothetical protein